MRGGLTDFYNMLQTGLVDHAMLWPEAAATFKIAEVAPYMLSADLGAVNTKTVTVNKDYWDRLPDEVKDVLQEVADRLSRPRGRHRHGHAPRKAARPMSPPAARSSR